MREIIDFIGRDETFSSEAPSQLDTEAGAGATRGDRGRVGCLQSPRCLFLHDLPFRGCFAIATKTKAGRESISTRGGRA